MINKIPQYVSRIAGICLLLMSCTEDEIRIKPYPSVETLDISNISESGATFGAKIDNVEGFGIIEHGFVWALKENPTIESSNKIIKNETILNDEFSEEVTTTLYNGFTYVVRAYVRTDNYLVYGKNKKFRSLGSSPATFSDFIPKIGTLGDTITLKGRNFSFKKEQNSVFFKNVESQIIHNTDSTITCIVPEARGNKTVPIFIEIANQRAQSEEDFSYEQPVINSVTPLNGIFGDEITITGENFSTRPNGSFVRIGSAIAQLTYSDENTLKALVPENIEVSSLEIQVSSDSQVVTYSEKFSIDLPEITSISSGLTVNGGVSIRLNNSHPQASKNIFFIEDFQSQIISRNNSDFLIRVPSGPFPRRKARIKVQVLDQIVEYPVDLNILNKWVLLSNDLPFRYRGAFQNAVVVNREAYVVAQDKDFLDDTFYLWKFNYSDFSWERNNIPSNVSSDIASGILESDGTNIYLYLPYSENNFWQFNPVTLVWSQKADFIGDKRRGPAHFSINGDIYIGLGVDFSPSPRIDYVDFYKYSIEINQWTRINDVPFNIFNSGGRLNASSFVLNGLGYFTGGALNTGNTDCWSYNPTTNTWNQIANFANPRRGTATFSLNGFGYVTGGRSVSGSNTNESWRYNPSSNSWARDENIGTIKRAGHFSFVIDGKAYIGGGGISDSGSETGFDLYEFIP